MSTTWRARQMGRAMADDTGERLKALEIRYEHALDTIEKMSAKVNEMHDLMMQAKGAKWAIIGLASLGGFVGAKITAFVPWIAPFPK